MNNLSLLSIMRADPEFERRISTKVNEIKADKAGLVRAADQYANKYQSEIVEGTLQRAKLLTEGKKRGLTENEVIQNYNRFIPTVYTPILNLLYFMFRETEGDDSEKYKRRDILNSKLVELGQLNHETDVDLSAEELDTLLDTTLKEIRGDTYIDDARKEANQRFLNEEREKDKLKDTPEMVEFLYGKITLEVFNKIKKLKALSKSSNDEEAFQAYRKALELCKEHNLEFDRIPCYVK